jgi:hypothetical protein
VRLATESIALLLAGLGIEALPDLAYLGQADVDRLQLPLVTRRKLMGAIDAAAHAHEAL